MDNVLGRSLRDTAMGLVQAFPAERGKLDLAKVIVEREGWAGLTTRDAMAEKPAEKAVEKPVEKPVEKAKVAAR